MRNGFGRPRDTPGRTAGWASFLLPRRSAPMDAEEVRRARVSRGWTVEEMADAVHASPLEVAAWEAGTVCPPEEQEAWIRWLAASDDWCAGVVEAGLSGCAWVREHAPDLHERILYDRARTWAVERDDVNIHYAACRACQAVWHLAQRLPPPPEPPGEDFHTVEARYGRWVGGLPRWLR
ncbi:MAG TPA: helix-turn-helix transcriptional regulator, partial [Longimicrobium sp.]